MPSFIFVPSYLPRGPLCLQRGSAQAVGLVACWPLMGHYGNVALFGGNTINSVGSGNVLSMVPGGVRAISLPGNVSTGFGQVGTPNGIGNPAAVNFSLSIRTYLRGTSNQSVFAISGGDGFSYVILNRGSTWKIEGYGNGSDPNVTGSAVAVYTEYVLTAVRVGTTNILYVNGQQVGTNTTTPQTYTPTSVEIGRFNSGFDPVDGWVWDARYYNRALSAAEAWALYDPATRYNVYRVPATRMFFDIPASGGSNVAPSTLMPWMAPWRS